MRVMPKESYHKQTGLGKARQDERKQIVDEVASPPTLQMWNETAHTGAKLPSL